MNKFLNKNIDKIILYFCFLMPILDLFTSLSLNVLHINFNFMIIVKVLVMMMFVYYLFFISKSKYKKISIISILSIMIYMLIFTVLTLIVKDKTIFTYEISNMVRTYYFPITLICLLNIYSEKKLNISFKHLSLILLSYLLLILIPLITHTSFNSYAYSKVGSVGWFNSTNEISGILSIILPLAILELFKIKNNIYKIIILLLSVYIYFSIGSKVPILSLCVILFTLILIYIIKLFKQKKYKYLFITIITLILLSVLGIIFVPKTSFYKNIVIHLDFLHVDSVDDLFDVKIIDHFIFSQRVTFMGVTNDNYIKADITQKIFGIGYIQNYGTDNLNMKLIEMDYYDIFYRHGIVGFLMFMIPYIYILINIFKKIFKMKKFDKETSMLILSLILILILSLFSGHIITAPSVSIFVCIIIVMLTKKLKVIK